MTLVNIDLREADSITPAIGKIAFAPTRRINYDGFVTLPEPIFVALVNGSAAVELAPTTAEWAWSIIEYVRNGIRRTVSVRDSTSAINYVDLQDVDVSTLTPIDPLPPTAQAILDTAAEAVSDASASAVAAAVAAASVPTLAAFGATYVSFRDATTGLPLTGKHVIITVNSTTGTIQDIIMEVTA